MKAKEYKKTKTGSVRIHPDTLNEAKKLCKSKGLLLTFFVTEAVKEKIEKTKK